MAVVAAASAPHSGDAWNDQILEAMERWRWPLPVTFVVLGVVAILGLHAVEWLLADLSMGEIDPFIISLPFYPLGILALIAIQNRVSLSALERFRPATDMDDAAYGELAHELTHQPAFSAAIAGLALGALGAMIEVTKVTAAERFELYPAAFVIYIIASFAFYAFAGPWIVRTFRLLRRVHRLHQGASHIDLLHPEPVHAFSSVTATVGVSFIAITTLSITTDPATHQTTGGMILTVALLAIAVACFVLPLWGMHRRLRAERARLGGELAARVEATIDRLYAHVDEDRPGGAELRDRMMALMATRDLYARLSTWPWQPETPRWLFSALLVPLVIWGATRLLERTLL